MAMCFYLESTTAPGLRFKVLHMDPQTSRAKLLGDTGVPFEREISQATLDKYGYKVVQLDEDKVEDASHGAVPAEPTEA